MNESRQSNFEILRIVAMLFIIIHHHLQNITMTCGYSSLYNYDRDGISSLIILVILSPLTIVIEKMTSKLKSCIVYKL